MIYIIHGEDLSSSRKFLINLQEQNNTTSRLDLEISEVSANEIAQKLNSIDMFGGKQMIVLDISKMGRMNVDEYVEAISKTPSDFILALLSNKDLTTTNAFIKASTKIGARVMQFKKLADSNIFKFADLVFDGNRKLAYKELKKLMVEGEDPIYIFTMLLYNLRNIAFYKFDSSMYNKLAPFVKSKVSKQAQPFKTQDIKKLYEDFYNLDIQSKTGQLDFELLVPMATEKVLTYF